MKLLLMELLWKLNQLRDPESGCLPLHEAPITLNCTSDGAIPWTLANHLKYLPLLRLVFDLEYIYLIWCSAALRARDGVIQVGHWVLEYAAGISAKLSGGCRRRIGVLLSSYLLWSFFRKENGTRRCYSIQDQCRQIVPLHWTDSEGPLLTILRGRPWRRRRIVGVLKVET